MLKGANADLWWEVWQVLRSAPGWTFEWPVPCRGNDSRLVAGRLAWQRAGRRSCEGPGPVGGHQPAADAGQVGRESGRSRRLIAESPVSHLVERPRRVDGSAVKARKRKALARPGRGTRRRIREPQREEPRAVAAADAWLAAAGCGRRRSAAHEVAWPLLPAVVGAHVMKPAAGPIQQADFKKSAAGALQ